MLIARLLPVAILGAALCGTAAAQFGGLFDPPRPPGNVPTRAPQAAPAEPAGAPGRVQSEDLPPAAGAPPSAPQGVTVTTAPSSPRAARGAAPPTALAPAAAAPAAAVPSQAAATAAAPPPADVAIPPPAQKIANPKAVFSGLDKITGRITAFDAAIGETVQFGALQVTARACYSRPPTETPLTDGFVEVDEVTLQGEVRRIFTGWMFAASPGLHAVEHPIYDVWLTDCKGGVPPVADAQPAPPPSAAAAPPARTQAPQRQAPPRPAPAAPRPNPLPR
jgi:hypothetical protein